MEFLCPAIKDNVGVLDIFVITKIRFLKCSVKKNQAKLAENTLNARADSRNKKAALKNVYYTY